MPQDEIMTEVRAIRDAYAERFGFDVGALYRDGKAREKVSRRRLVDLEPRRIEASNERKARQSA